MFCLAHWRAPVLHTLLWPASTLLIASTPLPALGQVEPPASASTEPAPTPDDTTVTLETVVVRASTERDERREATAAKLVVTREELERYGDATVADTLKRLPGVTVVGVPGRGGEVRMRGLGGNYTQILINGEPSSPGFTLDSIPPNLIERIEVLRTGTAELSTQAIAGTINIILKRVVRPAQRQVKLATATERGLPALFLDGQASDRDGPWSYTLAASARSERYRYTTDTRRVHMNTSGNLDQDTRTSRQTDYRQDTLSLSPRVNWAPDAQDTWTWEGFMWAQRSQSASTDRWSTVLGSPSTFAYNLTDAHRESLNTRQRLNWTRQLEDGAKVEVFGGMTLGRRDQPARYDGHEDDDALLLHRELEVLAKDRSHKVGGKYRAPLLSDHTLVMGGDHEHTRRDEARTQQDNWLDTATIDSSDERFAAQITRTALFVQDEWEINSQWSTYLGLRGEQLSTHTQGNGFDPVSRQAYILSPIIQHLWNVPDTQGDQIRLGFSRSYKAPDARDLMPRRSVTVDNSVTSPDYQGNPNLKPELATGLDLSYDHRLGGKGLLSASAFRRHIDNVTLEEVIYQNGRWISHPVNQGQALVYGLELEGKGQLQDWCADAPSLDVRLNVSRNWSAVNAVPGPNNRLNQQTPLTGTVAADWRSQTLPLTLGSSLSVLRGAWTRVSTAETAYTATKRNLDLYGVWKFSEQAQLRMSATNVLGEDIRSTRTYTSGTGSTQQSTVFSTAPSVRISAEIKL